LVSVAGVAESGNGGLFAAVGSDANAASFGDEILQIVFANSDCAVPDPMSDEKAAINEPPHRFVGKLKLVSDLLNG
jgi:hypothetical protein